MRRQRVNRHENGERASVGNDAVSAAARLLDVTAQKEAALYVRRFSVADMLHMCFDDGVVEKLRAVKGLTATINPQGHYGLLLNRSLMVDYGGDGIPTPNEAAFGPDPVRSAPLFEAIAQLAQIREKYAAVKHVLRYLNSHATPGAVRYYWPAILTLCKDSNITRDYPSPPSRYTEPLAIATHLPLLRETMDTVAGMQLMPSDLKVNERGATRLTFYSEHFIREGIKIFPDSITFEI